MVYFRENHFGKSIYKMDDDWGYPHDLGNPQMNIPMITGRKSSFSWFEVPPKIKSAGKVKEEPRDIFICVCCRVHN
jgi:hypothetical protein